MKNRLFKGLIAVLLSISFTLSPFSLVKAFAETPAIAQPVSSETKDQQVQSRLENELPSVKSELIGKVGRCEFKTDVIWIYFRNNLIDIIGILGAGAAVGLASSVPLVGGLASSTSNAINHVAANYIDAFIIGIISSTMLLLGGWLTQVVLNLNTNIMAADNPIIKAGFSLSLGLANIGFVIALIVIGIAIILRRKEYGSTKILTNLVIAIVLVNFGVFIAHFFTSISDIFIRAFVGDSCVGITLFNKLGAHQIQNAFGSNGGPIFNVLAAPITIYIADLISIIAVIIVFTILIYLIVRYVVVSLLIIAMPIAWLGFVFNKIKIPGIGNPWDYWWDNFIKWLIAGPLIAFFLYLMPYVVDIKVESTSAMGMIGVSLLHIILVIVVSIGGILITNKMSGVGSQFISKGVDAVFGGGMKYIGKLRQVGGQTGQLSSEKKLQQYLEEQMKAGKAPDRGKVAAFQAKIAGYKGLAGQETKFTRKAFDQAKLGNIVPFTSISAEEYRKSIGDPEKFVSSISGKKYKDLSDEEALFELDRLNKVSGKTFIYDSERLALLRRLRESGNRDKIHLRAIYDSGLVKRLNSKGINFDKEFSKPFGMTYQGWKNLHGNIGDKSDARKEFSSIYQKLKKEEFKDLPLDKIFKDYKPDETLPFDLTREELTDLASYHAGGIASNPQYIASAYTKLKGKERENFEVSLYSSLLENDQLFSKGEELVVDVPTGRKTVAYKAGARAEGVSLDEASKHSDLYIVKQTGNGPEVYHKIKTEIPETESERVNIGELRKRLSDNPTDKDKRTVIALRETVIDRANKKKYENPYLSDLAKAMNKQKNALGIGQFNTEE